VRGQGISDINDIADVQRMIYNLTSEIEQSIRMDGHPTLVVPPTAQLGSGAGGVIVHRAKEVNHPGITRRRRNPFLSDQLKHFRY
jgi:hypothetical protein